MGPERQDDDGMEPGVDEGLARELSLAAADTPSAPPMDELYRELRGRIEADEHGVAGFLRSRSNLARHLTSVLAVAAPLLLTWQRMFRLDGEVYPVGRMLLSVAMLGVLIAITLLLSLRPLQLPQLSQRAVGVTLTASLGALAVLYLLPEVSTGHPASLHPEGLVPLFKHAAGCSVFGLLYAAPLYALLRLMDRGDNPYGPLMAIAAGLSANMMLQLHCPVTLRAHMLLGHLGAVLLLLLIHRLTTRTQQVSAA